MVRCLVRPGSVRGPGGSGGGVRRNPPGSAEVRPVFGSRPDPPRPASKAIRLGLYTCILYLCIYAYIYIYIYGFLVCRYARSLRLAARQNTPALDGAFYRPNGTSYQLQPSFHTYSTEPEPTARARRAGKELCGVGACARLLPTPSEPRETSAPQIDRIPSARPPSLN